MKRLARKAKAVWLAAASVMVFGWGGSCVPDNLWADILGNSIITGGVEAVRNTLLVAANLQTP